MSKKNVLGRGVGALLPTAQLEEEDRFFMCDIEKIDPNPNQPRSYFDEEKLSQLSDSIKEKGVIQPLLVQRCPNGRYDLIAGERRLRAAKMAQQNEVPVVVMEENDPLSSLELALIENIQRHDLNPIEEAQAYERLLEEFKLTQEEVAKRVGKRRTTITNLLRLLKLPPAIQEDVVAGLLSEGHARVLLRLKDQPQLLQQVRDRIIAEELSVRATETLCRAQKSKPEQRPTAKKSSEGLPKSYCTTVINQITNTLNTKVRIVQSGKRGKVEIDYYSTDDLDRLVNLLSKQ
ncbi:ParB/RepB/Spo0J family partition protein [Desulfogranum mediterraneum]|uniref:ParB/RepB/Spo0J family partition protein n=1 Tax=Desulfogranum mediterraneum TaxID=160661 RepID=UPI0003F7FAC9|nr:ParB/RepB/Spo0J family partition protein [Desulfogranum mediterraneum]